MKFPCTLKNTFLIIGDCFGLSFASKGLGYFAALLLLLSLLARTNYLAIKILTTYSFSTCRHHLTENYLSFPSAPRSVRHSYLSKRDTIYPLYLWVINDAPIMLQFLSFMSASLKSSCLTKKSIKEKRLLGEMMTHKYGGSIVGLFDK